MENTDKDESTNPEPYFPDDAVTDPKDDRFQRWPFAQRIAQTIVARKESSCIVIGVYGAWGDGKTSVLNFIERELRQSSNIVCLKFNPWRFGDEATLIRSFFHNVANALSLSLSTRVEKIGELLNQYSSVLAPLSLALGSVVSVTPVTCPRFMYQLES